jgi:drug/metabolite transporter (DMT)-like permease
MPYLLLLLSILLTVTKSGLYNAYAKKTQPGLLATFGFNAASYGLAALIGFVVFVVGDQVLTLPTVLCALAYAAIVFSLQTISITAMKFGAMSVTTICVMYGMIIPSLAGPLFWHEPFGVLQATGILLMVASLWLLNGKQSFTASKLWVILAAIAFVLSGLAGVMEKVHQSTPGKAEKAGFVFIACLCMLAFSLIASLFARKKGGQLQPKYLLLLGAFSGVVIGFYSIVNLTLAGTLDSMIYYPVANGGAMLLTVVVSCLVFREKFDVRKILGVGIGLVGILALSIPV